MIFLVIVAIMAIWFYTVYAGLIKKKNSALEAFSGIDVQLKKRHDLIPNVVTLAKKFMEHEKSLLTEITALRASVQSDINPQDKEALTKRFADENVLANKMSGLFVAVENYPDLKSDTSILQAQQTYNEVEEHITASRRFYNSAVTELNNAVQIFPGSVVASMINVKEMSFFQADEADKKVVNVSDIM